MTKDSVLAILAREKTFVSGESMSRTIGVSRAAVNAAVKALKTEGYEIESVTNKGYMLKSGPDILSAGSVGAFLKPERMQNVLILSNVDSTNRYLREMAFNGAPDGQVVISGEIAAIEAACEKFKEAGARRALPLKVGGAFHSPLMEPARAELAEAIEAADFSVPVCPIYQDVDAMPHTDPEEIKANLLQQLTAPVRWSHIVANMVADGMTEAEELGPGKVLQGLIGKTSRDVAVSGRQ